MEEHMLSANLKHLVNRIRYRLKQFYFTWKRTEVPSSLNFGVLMDHYRALNIQSRAIGLIKTLCIDLDNLVLGIRIEFPDQFGFKNDGQELHPFGYFNFMTYLEYIENNRLSNNNYNNNNSTYSRVQSDYELILLMKCPLLHFVEKMLNE
jgi:hypothetical protein